MREQQKVSHIAGCRSILLLGCCSAGSLVQGGRLDEAGQSFRQAVSEGQNPGVLAAPPSQVNSLLWSHFCTINDTLKVSLHWLLWHTYLLHVGQSFFRRDHLLRLQEISRSELNEKVSGTNLCPVQWVALGLQLQKGAPSIPCSLPSSTLGKPVVAWPHCISFPANL